MPVDPLGLCGRIDWQTAKVILAFKIFDSDQSPVGILVTYVSTVCEGKRGPVRGYPCVESHGISLHF